MRGARKRLGGGLLLALFLRRALLGLRRLRGGGLLLLRAQPGGALAVALGLAIALGLAFAVLGLGLLALGVDLLCASASILR